MSLRKFTLVAATAAVAALGALGTTAAFATRSHGDAAWTVTIGAPVLTLPAPPLPLPRVVVTAPVPQPVVVVPVNHGPRYPVHGAGYGAVYGGYREPTRWDVDGDGIPNRHDRLYNPVWDRNGNGIPDHREYRHHGHPYCDRDHDGIPNRYDRRDDRHDGRYDERRPIADPHWRGGR